MIRKQLGRWAYEKPTVKVFNFETQETLLLETSAAGGHKKVGDDGELNAKQGLFEEDEDYTQIHAGN